MDTLRAFLLLGGLAVAAGAANIDIYVSPNYSDGIEDGSNARPFRTLTAARDYGRRVHHGVDIAHQDTVVVHLAPGTYGEAEGIPLELDAAHGDGNLVFRGDGDGDGARPLLTGGVAVPASSFKPVDGGHVPAAGVLVADVGALLDYDYGTLATAPLHGNCGHNDTELFLGGVPMTVARFPNLPAPKGAPSNAPSASAAHGTDPVPWAWAFAPKATPGGTLAYPAALISAARAKAWVAAGTAWIHGYLNEDWSDVYFSIDAADARASTFTLGGEGGGGAPPSVIEGARFYALNLLSELDAPGEYFLDRKAGRLYVYPPAGLDDAVLSKARTVVSARGVAGVRFENVDVAHARADGVSALNVTGFVLDGVRVYNVGGNGTTITGSRSGVVASSVEHAGCVGVSVYGGHPKTLARGDNFVKDSEIRSFSRWKRTYAPGLQWGGVGNKFCGNTIALAPHSAIIGGGNEAECVPSFSDAMNDMPCGANDNVFRDNIVSDVGWETTDAGGFYSCGQGGTAWVNRGNALVNNTFRRVRTLQPTPVNWATHAVPTTAQAIYLDDLMSGWTIANNTFEDSETGILLGGGRRSTISGNTFKRCDIAVHYDWREDDFSCNSSQPASAKATRAWPAWDKYGITFDHECLPAHDAVVGNRYCATPEFLHVCSADKASCGTSKGGARKLNCYCTNVVGPAIIEAKWDSTVSNNREVPAMCTEI